MNGLTIFKHSLRQVTGNFGVAVRVSWWLVAVVVVLLAAARAMLPPWLQDAMRGIDVPVEEIPDVSGGYLLSMVAVILAAVVFIGWSVSLIAIVWHRYILLEEVPTGAIPYRTDLPVGRYFWLGVGVSLVAVLVVGLASSLVGMVLGPFFIISLEQGGGAGSLAGALGFGLVIGVLVLVLYLRLALVLPAVALGDRLKMGQAWEASTGYGGAIFSLALIMAALNVAATMLLEMLAGASLIYPVLSIGYNWFYFMLNISVLSTLYGHIVQKREVY